MHFTNLLLLSTALAGASAANIHHRNHLEKRGGDFVKAVKPSPSKDVKANNIVDDIVDGITDTIEDAISDVYKAFCGGGVSRRATDEQIGYKGNTGTKNNYGCNIMQVAASLVDVYEYTMQITNVASEPYEVICWNKIGRKGDIDGFFRGMGESVTLKLGAGESAVVAFEANTQGACGFGKGSLPTSDKGCYQGTWAEVDFENASNKGWSGADCSALTSEDTGGKVEGCKLCDAGEKTCSIIYPDGTGENSYTKGTNDLDGIGLNTVPGNVTYYLEIGYSK